MEKIMNKELIDRTWSALPKEFKEEVKERFTMFVNEKNPSDCSYGYLGLLIKLFGLHNLTSDAEGEEMLMCEKYKVHGFYQEALELIDRGERNNYLNDKLVGIGQKNVIYALFGSKCLPDEDYTTCVHASGTACKHYNHEESRCSLHGECKFELNEDNFASKEPKSAEPKFKVGDKVECLLNHHIYVIRHLDFYDGIWRYNYGNPAIWIKESDLELYKSGEDLIPSNSGELNPQEADNQFCNLSQETASCDKQFDAILKNSFAKERRLKIAAMMAQGILSNTDRMKQYGEIAMRESEPLTQLVARNAMRYADAIIAECEKGGEGEQL